MAADPFDALRLSLMEDLLPVGIAVVDRARRGGPRQVVEAFTATDDPLAQLRQEGDAAAKKVRESLDQVQPGLGNPVVKVEVRDVPSGSASDLSGPPPVSPTGPEERRALQEALARVSGRLEELERRLGA
ncbi:MULTISPECIES: hypothetical protein [unclassified Synechococcus]|uniref:hypothetical protein n=1 Tax=unclassified Synechococcus TaxID=2626047 RepID=UPI00006983D4|nr:MULTISPECIES: hypothetical protein [unclassified Synechococcus]EAQ75769.1 hypothetical protein WH5701_02949 [Synechococcus sp. WH 5701]MCP9826095.1 hypothetical protein [Synechococcus sp. EJ6-Ellesmere]WFN59572.1 hypothetical protein N4320_02895 [Synechococcus sp. CCFWC 502]